MNVLIAYESKYGNTKIVAELIGKGIKASGDNEVTIEHVKAIDPKIIEKYDILLVGSPNHIGSHTKTVKKFINSLSEANLKGKSYAVFDTYFKNDIGKAIKKMEKNMDDKLPDLKKLAPGLSIKVGGMKGPIVEEDLSKCEEFGKTLTEKI